MQLFECRYASARAMSTANEMRRRQGKGRVRSRMYCRRLPRGRNSLMMRIRGRSGIVESAEGGALCAGRVERE